MSYRNTPIFLYCELISFDALPVRNFTPEYKEKYNDLSLSE
jgi:hypothetical protein